MNQPETASPPAPRKQEIRDRFDRLAEERGKWIARNWFFHEDDRNYMRFLVPAGLRVLELGCGTGEILHALDPSHGVGVDFSEQTIDVARGKYPELDFVLGDVEDPATLEKLEGPFDVIVLSDTIGYLDDCQALLASLHPLCTAETRLVVAYYSHFWEPVLKLAEWFGNKMPQPPLNWITPDDLGGIMALADFEVIKREWRQILPKHLFGIGRLVNRFLGTLPFLRRLSLRNYVVARSLRAIEPKRLSASVVIPCRNEQGNIEDAVRRMPKFCDELEILFVEGNSVDDTFEECERVKSAYPDLAIEVFRQEGEGKGDAVRKGFQEARGEVLMILDADLTVPPEALPKFYEAIANGKGEFINGTRMVYPLERDSMRFLNYWANRAFAWLFTWLLNQRFTDTLCGTKVLRRDHYERVVANRAYFGNFDPFGDFDLIFGAAKLNLKTVEVPVRYASRNYGTTQISRFQHGWLLLRMAFFAYRKLKAF
ncbi:MAG: glycosyltransferase [Alphaproteobacteria bacterium]|nr:glycosyltransferase [Alphaproteobacteria bacterium]